MCFLSWMPFVKFRHLRYFVVLLCISPFGTYRCVHLAVWDISLCASHRLGHYVVCISPFGTFRCVHFAVWHISLCASCRLGHFAVHLAVWDISPYVSRCSGHIAGCISRLGHFAVCFSPLGKFLFSHETNCTDIQKTVSRSICFLS